MAKKVGFGDEADGDRPKGLKGRKRLIPAFFLTLWLIGWTFGIFYVSTALLGETGASDGFGSLAMTVWLILAVIGWLIGARALRRVLRGEALNRRDGSDARPSHQAREPSESDR
ncbi:MAG: hypothetical protein AAF360_01115 [Pseudomonadota bacterium]